MKKNDELKKYSLEELKKMPRYEVIKLDVRQLPLSEKALSYFYKRVDKFMEYMKNDLAWTQDYLEWKYKDYAIKNRYFITLQDVLSSKQKIKSTKFDDIYTLCDTLEFTPRDVISMGYAELPKEQLLLMEISELIFPKEQLLLDNCCNSNSKLDHLLSIDVDTRYREIAFENITGSSVGSVKKIKDHLIKLGFQLGEYPFLKKSYWDRIDEIAKSGKNRPMIKLASRYSYNTDKDYLIVISEYSTHSDFIVPFEGTYQECVVWLDSHIKVLKNQ